VAEIYLPLSRLLNFYISSNLRRQAVLEQFLGTNGQRIPYIISIAGSVAVGKSTTARVLQALLSRWPEHRSVELITTDGFLHPNEVLKERGLMKKKGFPLSYDMHRLVKFVSDLKSGAPNVTAPVYSHLIYDRIPDGDKTVVQPDILILGTLIGAFVIGFLADGLVMMGVSEFWQMVIKGIVIIVAVIIDQMQNRMQQKAAVVAQKAVMEGK
jgi:type I pantothenate kinase